MPFMLIDIPNIMNHDRPKLLLRIFLFFFTLDHRWKRSARENEEIDETVNFQHFLLFVCKNILNFSMMETSFSLDREYKNVYFEPALFLVRAEF